MHAPHALCKATFPAHCFLKFPWISSCGLQPRAARPIEKKPDFPGVQGSLNRGVLRRVAPGGHTPWYPQGGLGGGGPLKARGGGGVGGGGAARGATGERDRQRVGEAAAEGGASSASQVAAALREAVAKGFLKRSTRVRWGRHFEFISHRAKIPIPLPCPTGPTPH